jgi:hypothetical protein
MSEVKPCPFCGTPAYIGKHPHYPGQYLIRCGGSDSKCIFPSTGPIPDGLLSLYIERWNTRYAVSEMQ